MQLHSTLRKTMYSFWKLDNSPLKDPDRYKNICVVFNTLLSTAAIETGRHIKLPERMGYIGVLKVKTKKKSKAAPNWTNIWKGLPVTKHRNAHSEKYYVKFSWEKGRFLKKLKRFWTFKTSRTNARKLSNAVKNNNAIINYLEYVKN